MSYTSVAFINCPFLPSPLFVISGPSISACDEGPAFMCHGRGQRLRISGRKSFYPSRHCGPKLPSDHQRFGSCGQNCRFRHGQRHLQIRLLSKRWKSHVASEMDAPRSFPRWRFYFQNRHLVSCLLYQVYTYLLTAQGKK